MTPHFFDRQKLKAKQRLLLAMATGSTGVKNPIILFGGAGGGGKSHGLRELCVYALLLLTAMGYPGQRVMLACINYPLLRDRHLGKFEQQFAWLGAKITNSQIHGLHVTFTKAPHIGVIALRNLEDPNYYKGTECVGIAIDEVTELPEKVAGEPVMGTLLYPLRQPKDFPFTFLVFGSNPDGVGHLWVKNTFITRSEKWGQRPERFHYIEARHTDNDSIGADWYEGLNALSEDTRNARLNADWTMPKGARFPMCGDHHRFKFSERFPRGLPASYKIILHVDYGHRAPYCALWTAIDEQGDCWTYREDYRSGLYDEVQAKRILELTRVNERGIRMRGDPAMWSRKPNDSGKIEPAYIEAYERILGQDPHKRFLSLEPGYNQSRGHALGSLHKLLDHGNGLPNWYIEEACENLWSELCGAVWDQKDHTKEDIDPRNPDHAITAAYYGLHYHLEPSRDTDRRVITLQEVMEARRQEQHERDELDFEEFSERFAS